jgi:Ca2+-transporting ATPase
VTNRQTNQPGLSSSDAQLRLSAHGFNELPTEQKTSLVKQIWAVLKQPMLLLLLGAGSINFALSDPFDGSMLLFFVFVVIGIWIFQERKSQKALAALKEFASPKSRVIRDGVEVVILSRLLVEGDLVLISEGDRIPADGTCVDAQNLSIDESALTGESVPVERFKDDPVFSGTLVVAGRATILLTATGKNSQLGKIGKALAELENESTPLQREVSRLILWVATIAFSAAALVAIAYAISRGDLIRGLLAGIATAMAMIPEEFPVVLTLFMVLGSWRMAKGRVLAKRPQVIETLGSATVLCVDKTGTLTTNEMVVAGFFDGDQATIGRYASLASANNPTDPMDRAFRAAEPVAQGLRLVREYSISKELLAHTQVWSDGSGKYLVACKGAPETVAALCKIEVPAKLQELASSGFRVLGVARAEFSGELPESVRDFDFTYLGLAGLKDPIRPTAKQAISDCYAAGIRTIMITGDYPATAMAIARELEIDSAAGHLTGAEVEALNDSELAERLKVVNVFARMVPEQKLRIIAALKADGEVVGMTGDGVNDAPALRAADIGIAMGLRGTDVARAAADLVVTDDDFGSIERGVRQGRTIFANLRKAMAYIVAVHIPLLGMSVLPVFADNGPILLIPLLIAVLELIIDPACSIVFESESADPDIMKNRPRKLGERILTKNVLTLALIQGFVSFLAVVSVYFWAVYSEASEEQVRTLTFASLVLGNLALILVNRSWSLTALQTLKSRKNPTLWWLFLGAVATLLVLVYQPVATEAFELAPLSIGQWLICAASALAGVAWFEVRKLFKRKPKA